MNKNLPTFIESICIENNKPKLLSLHQNRVDKTLIKHKIYAKINLSQATKVKGLQSNKKYKLRIVYDNKIVSLDCTEYQKRRIEKLKIIPNCTFDYSYKFYDRNELDNAFNKRGDADEIIMINNDGYVTDGYYFNLVFEKGGKFYTPKTCMLNGIMRQHLIHSGKIKSVNLYAKEIHNFEKVHLINALNRLGEINIPTSHVVF
jgi:4-amino-4-deoxychorismate lyase